MIAVVAPVKPCRWLKRQQSWLTPSCSAITASPTPVLAPPRGSAVPLNLTTYLALGFSALALLAGALLVLPQAASASASPIAATPAAGLNRLRTRLARLFCMRDMSPVSVSGS
jgi:hypothetical protein